MIGFISGAAVSYLLYYWVVKPFTFWSRKHVKTGRIIPFFGDNFRLMFGKESFADMFNRIYNKVDRVRYLGAYHFFTPGLVLKSPELIKRICVKDFDHFLNHKNIIPDGVDDLFSKNLSALQGEAWKKMRSTLSPTFTSSKIKSMFILICQNANSFVEYFLKEPEEIIEIDMKDAFTRYTMDVIASTAFGFETDSLTNKENEFYLMGKDAADFSKPKVKIAFLFYQFAPSVAKFFGVDVISKKVRTYFYGLVKETIALREKQNIQRPDMLGLLIESRKGVEVLKNTKDIKDSSFAAVEEHLDSQNTKQYLTDSDITAQAFIFFVAGFENVSTAMSFLAYELAVNPTIQEKLIEEIDDVKLSNGSLTYESLMGMVYLDMVVTELLRKWPLAVATDRVTTKAYTIESEFPDERTLLLSKGDLVWIPIYGIHHDPNYYENPEKFDPDRFSPENRKKIDPYTYLPFGAGPRNCIASRFVLLEMKTILFHLLSQFEIVPTEKTHIPMVLKKSTLNLTSEHGFHLGLKKRS